MEEILRDVSEEEYRSELDEFNKEEQKKEFVKRRKAWVDTLRSDYFVQGRGGLRTRHDEYCCLGVACKVFEDREESDFKWRPEATPEDIKEDTWELYEMRDDMTGGEMWDSSHLPSHIQEYFDISSTDIIHLTQMNDGLNSMRRHNFEEIANFIEEMHFASEPYINGE